jgi:glutamate-1-semialdehyde 2,1-aminomutase
MENRSTALYRQAQACIVGGVNSPVRAFKGVGGTPVFAQRGEGAYFFSADGQRYIDYVGSWGPLILGHAHPTVISAVQQACSNGLSFGMPCEIETQLAKKICQLMPNVELVRMVNSGTEATMTAIRLARGFTGRSKIIKFNGCYHGHSDSLLAKAGSGLLTLGIPSCPGIPPAVAEQTLTLEFNDLEGVKQTFSQCGEAIAAIIVEPIAGNMNFIPASNTFLAGLRALCDQYSSLLIFDEVMTGFRVALGGAQALYNIKPDLTTLGKVIGGGMPVGALGGSQVVMEHLAPLGAVYQAGTLAGNPIAMQAGLSTLELIANPKFYQQLGERTEQLVNQLAACAQATQLPFSARSVGGMFGFTFTSKAVNNFADIQACDSQLFAKFFHAMLAEGIYFAPSAYEAGFVSSAHSSEDIAATVAAAEKVFAHLADD